MKNLKQIIRSFSKQKVVNLLSIGGLSIGITIALLMSWWVVNEFNFDTFNTDFDKIYRITNFWKQTGKQGYSSCWQPPSVAGGCKKFPEVDETVRCTSLPEDEVLCKSGHLSAFESSIRLVDSNFFSFFTYPLKSGDRKACLNAPNSIVVSEDFAGRYFPDTNPVGKNLKVGDLKLQITGVMHNMPKNSHLQFDACISMHTLPAWDKAQSWFGFDRFLTYAKVNEKSDTKLIADKLRRIAYEKEPEIEELSEDYRFQFVPLKKVHFFGMDDGAGRLLLLTIYLLISVIILLISCVNFSNLFISTSFLRAKQIGIKKTNGASRLSLIREFYAETAFYVAIATVAALILASELMPHFNALFEAHLVFDLKDIGLYMLLAGIFLLTSIIAGTYPALYITRFNPVATIGGKFKGKKASGIQKGLIVFQFTASIILLITVFTVKKQVHFMQNADIGLDKSNVVYVKAMGAFGDKYDLIKSILEEKPSIKEVTCKMEPPFLREDGAFIARQDTPKEQVHVDLCWVKPNYFDMFGIQYDGEIFRQQNMQADELVINKAAAEKLGYDNPIGETVMFKGKVCAITAVADDVKRNMRYVVYPQVYGLLHDTKNRTLLVKTAGDNKAAIKAIQEQWSKYNQDYPFQYFFLDEEYDKLYKYEVRAGKIVSLGMVIAMFITVMGLFAMARYASLRRTKEVCIRKINGAKVKDILLIFNREFLLLALLAFIVAAPLAYWLIRAYFFTMYAYKTPFSWWIFALAGLLVILTAAITVSWQSYKTASQNPVDGLRYE